VDGSLIHLEQGAQPEYAVALCTDVSLGSSSADALVKASIKHQCDINKALIRCMDMLGVLWGRVIHSLFSTSSGSNSISEAGTAFYERLQYHLTRLQQYYSRLRMDETPCERSVPLLMFEAHFIAKRPSLCALAGLFISALEFMRFVFGL
jgi:hypothetical protein